MSEKEGDSSLFVWRGDTDYLCSVDSDSEKPPSHRIPLKEVSSWFQREGTLVSWDEVNVDVEPANAKVSVLEPAEIAATKQKSMRQNLVALTRTETNNIQTSPHSIIHIYPLVEELSPSSYLVRVERTTSRTQSSLVVSNCSGYWVSDYCHLGGFQQVLFLPIRTGPRDALETLHCLLDGTILTDGMDLWLSWQSKEAMSVQTKQRTLSSNRYRGMCPELVLFAKDGSLKHVSTRKRPAQEPTTSSSHPSMMEDRPALPIVSTWRDQFEASLRKRLLQQEQLLSDQRAARQSQEYVLKKSQTALQQVIQQEFSGCQDVSAVQLTGLQYRVYPRTATNSTTSATLWIQADVMIPSATPSNSSQQEQELGWKDAHISCVPASHESIKNIPNGTCQSGVIPEFSPGDHTSVLLAVHLDEIALPDRPLSCDDGTEGVMMTVGIIGRGAGSKGASEHCCGLYLGTFCVSLDTILQAPFGQTWHRLHCPSNMGEKRPTVVYDCRTPYPVRIDLSCCQSLDVSKLLQELNDRVCGNSMVRIDRALGTKLQPPEDGESMLCLVVFAMTQAEVFGILPLIVGRIPGNVKILT